MAEITGNESPSSSFLDVCLALKTNVMKSMNCAEIMQVTEVNVDYARCSALYNTNIVVEAYYPINFEIEKNDIVLVIFTDHDFRSNLIRIKQGQSLQTTESTEVHQKQYGIITTLIYTTRTTETE